VDTFDVVVIGGGAAGAAAALSAAHAGARTALVRAGPGATALAGGGWRDAPPPSMRDALTAAGLDLIRCDGALPHPDGVLVRCELAALSHANAAIGPGTRAAIVCGIAGLPSFHAASLAVLWSEEAGLPDGALQAVTVMLDGTPTAGWSPASLAALLDREPERLGHAIRRVAKELDARSAIVPAVLGIDNHARTVDAICETAGILVGEALGVAPSVPGWRLDQALLRAIADSRVQLIAGRVVRAESRDGIAGSVSVQTAAGLIEVHGLCYVLAAGKFTGGGITAAEEFEERTLGCDVALERFARTIDDPGAALMLTDPVRTEPQPVLAAGVRVDGDGRPLTESNDVYLRNVFVAGSVRAGIETAALGLGGAMHQGWSAGERAAALASGG
jgi:glycerol-3-phosphate dehydrogenase subunit B